MKYPSLILLCCLEAIWTSGQVKNVNPQFYVDSGISVSNFHSKTIDEDYTIFVNLPPDYDSSKSKYPVLYLTDGDWNVQPAMTCFSMLDQDYTTTIPIIVGIGYGDRSNMRCRDLDPATGGPKFLTFIAEELIPFINIRYRTTEDKALYGYSYGGMFATYVLFSRPDLFKTIFIGAPGNSGRALLPSAEKYFVDHSELNNKLFVGVGSYEGETVSNVNKFRRYMLKRHPKGLAFQSVIIENAGHGAGIAPVMQAGMKFAYCKTHIPIHLTTKQLQKYSGRYKSADFPELKLRVFERTGKLYFQQGDQMPVNYVPFAPEILCLPE